jgi:hypothetical protein
MLEVGLGFSFCKVAGPGPLLLHPELLPQLWTLSVVLSWYKEKWRLADLDFKCVLSLKGGPHPNSPNTHWRITWGFARTGTHLLSCLGIATQVSSHTRRSLRTLLRTAVSVSLIGSDKLLQTTDMPGAPRTHFVYSASPLLSCSVQSVSGVHTVNREKEKQFKSTSWDIFRSS